MLAVLHSHDTSNYSASVIEGKMLFLRLGFRESWILCSSNTTTEKIDRLEYF